MESYSDATELYPVEHRSRYAERDGFRISELQISATQFVPWHFHTSIDDTFYVIAGRIRIQLKDPADSIELGPAETFKVKAGRPHLVRNADEGSATFLVLQGIGEYDYVPLGEGTLGDP